MKNTTKVLKTPAKKKLTRSTPTGKGKKIKIKISKTLKTMDVKGKRGRKAKPSSKK
jgi:hypothetical protein